MLNIVLFGAPGAGKGTQCEMLIEKYGLITISTGELLRKEVAAQSEIGKKVEHIINGGGLVSDDLVIKLLEKAIKDFPGKGILFDGFPRNIVQAYILEGLLHRMGRGLDLFLSLEVPKEVLIDRMLKRSEIENRADDNKEVIAKRFQEYENKTIPVEDYYKDEGLYFAVDGTGSKDEVFAALCQRIDEKLAK